MPPELAAVQHYRALQPVPIRAKRAKGATPDVRWPRWPELRVPGWESIKTKRWTVGKKKSTAEPENTITATCASHLLLLPKSNQVLPAASTSAQPAFVLFCFVSFFSLPLSLSLFFFDTEQQSSSSSSSLAPSIVGARPASCLASSLAAPPRGHPLPTNIPRPSFSGSLRLPVSCFPKEAVSSPRLRP